MLNLLDKDKYILHGAADSIRQHNQIHNKKERNAVLITDYLDFAAELIDLLADDKVAIVKHGRWIPTEYNGYANGNPVYDAFECSECGHEHNGEEDTLTAFCPDCGAKMDGGTKQ